MRLNIRQKIFLLGFGLTFILVFLAFITSFFSYKNRVEKKYDDTLKLSIEVANDWFSDIKVGSESYKTLDSRSDVVEYIVKTYTNFVADDETYPDLNNKSNEELYKYLSTIYSDLYPPQAPMSMSKTGPINRSHFASLKSDLVSALGIADGIQGDLVYYDKKNDRYLNIVDTIFRFDDANYVDEMPGSYKKLDDYDHKVINEIKNNGYYKEGNQLTYFIDIMENDDLSVRLILKYDKTVVADSIRAFSIILASTLIGISILLVVSYVFFAHLMIVKNVKKLTLTSDKFKEKLLNNDGLEVINTNINSRDEIGILSESFLLLENEIINYAERVEDATKEKERMNAELSVASKIQLESLPKNNINDKNVLVSASITSAKEVGGDFYDYFYIDDKHLAIIISDVSGKGIPAALFMMRSKELIKSKLLTNKKLEDVLFEVNNELLENNEAGLFITSFIGVLNVETKSLNFINAGHERPYLIRENEIKKLDVKSNFILGGIENFKYESEEIKLFDNDIIFMYTDGLNESINDCNEEFGYARISNNLEKSKNEEIKNIINNMQKSLNEFTKDKEAFDDITMLVLEIKSKNCNFHFENPKFDIIEEVINKFNDYYSYLDKKILSEVSIIFDEMLNNYISYEKVRNLFIDINTKIINDELIIEFINNGLEFNPLNRENKKILNDSRDVEIGGFGISIVKNLSSDISYERKNEENVLTIKKLLNK